MEIKVVFTADSIVQTSDGGIQLFPPTGEPTPLGVGVETTGRYVIKHKKHVTGQYTFNRINSYEDNKGRIHGIGQLVINLCYQGNDITITTTYTIRTADPANPFSVDLLDTPITSALVNGLLAQGKMFFKPIEGGKCYKVCIELEPVHRCPPPPPCPPCLPCPVIGPA